ncbi:MAG: hypothetical protein QOC59_650 [Microbacteriaceae bacterium]|nr:hypothetical protein [Microbacteriaceae bacterium]
MRSYARGVDAGYSGTPLWRKLGLKPGSRARLEQAPAGWGVGPVPHPVEWLAVPGSADLVLAFCRSEQQFLGCLDRLGEEVFPAGMLWIAWPRKAAGHVSDLDENTIRDTALRRGLVDVKVAALDPDWSALKLVWRKENRVR